MKIQYFVKYIFFFINLIPVNCFMNLNLSKKISIQKDSFFNENVDNIYNINNFILKHNNIKNYIKYNISKKIKGFTKIIRPNNILPTLALSFFGGLIINSSQLKSKQFIVSTINTLLIMSSSMIINDIYDIEIDKINNPERPLITGEVTIKEAILYIIFLLGVAEYLSLKYLKSNLQWIIHFAIIKINIYTPILKKIVLIKNISCALLVSFSIFFTGLSVINLELLKNSNFAIFLIALNLVFFGSFTNEIILDIRDYNGDKEQNINTIPTVFGKKFSWIFVNIVLYLNLIYNNFLLKSIALLYNFIMIPQLIYLNDIKKCNYSNYSINKYMKQSNYTLFSLLLYLIFLSR